MAKKPTTKQQMAAAKAKLKMNSKLHDAMQAKFDKKGFLSQEYYKGKNFQKALKDSGVGKMSEKDFAKYAMSQGWKMDKDLMGLYGTKKGGTNNLGNAKNLKEAFKIAAATGKEKDLISTKEWQQIYDKWGKGKGSMRLLNKLDAFNKGATKKGWNAIGVQSNVLNQTAKGKWDSGKKFGSDTFMSWLGKSYTKPGSYAGLVNNMTGSKYKGAVLNGQGWKPNAGYGKTPYMPKGLGVYGSYKNHPIFGNASSGKGWANTSWGTAPDQVYKPWATSASELGLGGYDEADFEPEVSPVEPGAGAGTGSVLGIQGGSGAAGMTNATGFSKVKSSWQLAGKSKLGTKNFKYNYSSGMNF